MPSKRDILETEQMLTNLTNLLYHAGAVSKTGGATGDARADAEQLRRISMTLHSWYELECNGEIQREEKWAIERVGVPATDTARWWDGSNWVRRTERRTYDDHEKANYEKACGTIPIDAVWCETGEEPHYVRDAGGKMFLWPIADPERGALERLDAIMKRYPSLSYYVQTDPRGCALYILRPGDVPEGERAESYYTRGLAVHR